MPYPFFGDPSGNRTHVYAVRGRRLSRLTIGPYSVDFGIISHTAENCKPFSAFFSKNFYLCLFTLYFALRSGFFFAFAIYKVSFLVYHYYI